MASKLVSDPRIDPRIKVVLGAFPEAQPVADAKNREELVAAQNSPEANARFMAMKPMMDALDNEQVAPSAGLVTRTETFTAQPDANEIKVQFIRPEGDAVLPGVVYLHGGGMASMSAFDGMYRAWGRLIAAEGVAVAMVDFRNALRASSAPDIA
ncbi:MAG TPA: hypothetical protein VME40_20315, partial [Caulobacteraceae bacterium]|nr:hypothetical protein [Caulobacteraceae bacterium]